MLPLASGYVKAGSGPRVRISLLNMFTRLVTFKRGLVPSSISPLCEHACQCQWLLVPVVVLAWLPIPVVVSLQLKLHRPTISGTLPLLMRQSGASLSMILLLLLLLTTLADETIWGLTRPAIVVVAVHSSS